MKINVFDDYSTLRATLIGPPTSKVSTSYIKGILNQMMNEPYVIDFWNSFFEETTGYTIGPGTFNKPSIWKRWSKEKNNGMTDLFPDNSIVRTFGQTLIDEDNFRFEVFSDPTDTTILGIVIVTD